MKSNRMRRLYQPAINLEGGLDRRMVFGNTTLPLRLEKLPAPLPIEKVSPDKLIEDILVSTLRRVQDNASAEVAAAAARYISLLSENAL